MAQEDIIHVPASKSLIGFWRQTGYPSPKTGEPKEVVTGNFKVINADGSFYTFSTYARDKAGIGQYGTYKVTSDSTLTEIAVKHILTPSHTGKISPLKYKLIDENTLMVSWKHDETRNAKELWTRVPTSFDF